MSMQSSETFDENLTPRHPPGLPAATPLPRNPYLRENLRSSVVKEIDSADLHLHAVLKEADTTRLRLRSLYTQLNALAPVSLLPVELLARVFHFIRDGTHANLVFWFPFWATVTHVCRHWREVALGDSSLWSALRDFPSSSQRWLAEMLIRSKEAPLHIDMHFPRAGFLRSLVCHSFRIRTLIMDCLEISAMDDGLQHLLVSEAHQLEELHLATLMCASPPIVVLDALPFSMDGPFKIFSGQTPKLRRVYLHDFHIPWTYFPRTCSLTHLSVISTSSGAGEVATLGSLDELIDVLASSPNLKRLTLDRCLAPVSSQTALANVMIDLPHLIELNAMGPSSSVLRLFQSFRAPSLWRLSLTFVATNHAEVVSQSKNAPIILSHFYRMGSAVFVTLGLDINRGDDLSSTKFTVAGYSSCGPPPLSSLPKYNTVIELEFKNETGADHEGSHEIIIREACAAFRMSELENLFVSCPKMRDPPLWTRQVLERCINVVELHADGLGTEPLLLLMKPQGLPSSASRTRPHENRELEGREQDFEGPQRAPDGSESRNAGGAATASSEPALLFPNLTYLLLDDLDFQHPHNGERIYNLVFKIVKRRKQCGARLRNLHVTRCNVSSYEADSLEPLVRNFRWDQDEDSEHETDR
ncbi:hypothetical protein BC834DRAFT_970481 [Gloeopeniophorella convolvens]|nr:hypothetical protein BC834DRAFT_970481 [Gloeopeniophorella convolvens]